MAKGGTPILTAGLKAQPISVNAHDAQLAEVLKLSDQAIANVFRVPLQMLGIGNNTASSTEALMQYWLASGLGFVLNHIEEAIGLLFKLKGQPDEYLEFDTSALLRSSFKDRVEGWVAGTKGGVFPRNAALREFEMKPVEGGDEVWVQQQDIPLSVALENAKNPPKPPPPPPPPLPVGPNTEDLAEDMKDLRGFLADGLAAIAEAMKAIPQAPSNEEIGEFVEAAVQRSLPAPAEPIVQEPSDDELAASIEAFSGMALLKEFSEQPVAFEMPPAPAQPVVKTRKQAQPMKVTIENHIPRAGSKKTTVTKHDDNGRIVEFEQREVEE